MKVILFGASGMVGQGVLRECLLDPEIENVLAIGRSSTAQRHAKLEEIVRPDVSDLEDSEERLRDYDACFFCLGVSAAGMTEADYRRVTYDLALKVAGQLARINPAMTFIFVSGSGTDTSGRMMWARVKGETEDALLRLPFKAAYMFRPGFIQPLHGIASKTKLYRVIYAMTGPLIPLLKALFPSQVTTTEEVGRAMISVAKLGFPKRILESRDISGL